MKNYFDAEFTLWHFEMDKFGEATPTIMLALLEEAAAEHCDSIGYGLYNLLEKDIGWVLVSGALHIERYPRYKEKIKIRTWLSSYSTIRGFRESLIFDEKGKIIARAKGLWIFYNIRKRKPVPVFEKIKDSWSFIDETTISSPIPPKIKPVDQADYIDEITVRASDVDIYKHANNIRYLQWLIDSIPDKTIECKQLKFIEGKFISEIKCGDQVVMMSQKSDQNDAFIHTIKNKDTGHICAVAKTQWDNRHNHSS